MRSLTIALDYDDTYTADPDLWDRFIADARERRHRILIVTARRKTPENIQHLKAAIGELPVYFTDLESKTWYMAIIGESVDIWIDDSPETLVNGH